MFPTSLLCYLYVKLKLKSLTVNIDADCISLHPCIHKFISNLYTYYTCNSVYLLYSILPMMVHQKSIEVMSRPSSSSTSRPYTYVYRKNKNKLFVVLILFKKWMQWTWSVWNVIMIEADNNYLYGTTWRRNYIK